MIPFPYDFTLPLKKKLQSREIPIYLRIMVNRQKAELSTRQVINSMEEWDTTIQHIKKPKDPRNAALNKIEGDLKNIYDELEFNKREYPVQLLKISF